MNSSSRLSSFFRAIGQAFRLLVTNIQTPTEPCPSTHSNCRCLTVSEKLRAPSEVTRAMDYVGIFSRIAKRESLSVSHVIQVAKGNRSSKRVIDAIVHEVHRIESQQEREI